jgi:hypothetical protein
MSDKLIKSVPVRLTLEDKYQNTGYIQESDEDIAICFDMDGIIYLNSDLALELAQVLLNFADTGLLEVPSDV